MSSSLDSCMELASSDVKLTPLKDLAEFQRGDSITKKSSEEGEYPVISGGQKPAYYINQFNRTGETITVAGSGAYAGFVMYWNKPIFVSDAFSIKVDEQRLLPRYAYHFLLSMQDKIHALKLGSGVPHVYAKDVAKIPIPIPFPNNRIQSLAIQAGIVRILDSFSGLVDKLEAELICRKRQYEYFLNHLLSFDHENLSDDVSWYQINELFDIRNGYTPSKSNQDFWDGGDIPWFRIDDIRDNGRFLSDSIQHITSKGVKGKLFPANSIILATSATIGEHALLQVEALSNQRFTNFAVRDSFAKQLIPKFVFYYFFKIDKWCEHNTNVSSFAAVDMTKLKALKFPIPPLTVQERIVGILDNFDRLCHDAKVGIPAELAARRKQYEFFREMLLNFSKSE